MLEEKEVYSVEELEKRKAALKKFFEAEIKEVRKIQKEYSAFSKEIQAQKETDQKVREFEKRQKKEGRDFSDLGRHLNEYGPKGVAGMGIEGLFGSAEKLLTWTSEKLEEVILYKIPLGLHRKAMTKALKEFRAYEAECKKRGIVIEKQQKRPDGRYAVGRTKASTPEAR